MNIAVLTSLYPGDPKPLEGVFAERRWVGMLGRGHRVRVVQPLPRAPWPLGGRYGELRAMPFLEERCGIPIRRPRYLHLPRAHRSNPDRFARAGVAAILSGERPEVVVLDYAWPAAAAVPGLRAAGLPVVINGRGSDVLQVAGEAGLGDLLAAGLCGAGHWSAVSRDLVQAMDRLARQPGRGCLVPNGVDLEVFHPLEPARRVEVRSRHGLDPKRPLVLVVGHLIARKDPLLALGAFLEGAPPQARLAFVGRGPLREDLDAGVRARSAEGRVDLLGELPPEQLAPLLGAADLLLLTSSREGRPNVVLEALAAGTPIVATRAGGTAELVPGYEERLLVEERSPEAIGARLRAVLEDPPTPVELRRLVQPLSWSASFGALEDCLARAIAEDL